MQNVCLPSLPQCSGEEILMRERNHHNSVDSLFEQRQDIPRPRAAMHGVSSSAGMGELGSVGLK